MSLVYFIGPMGSGKSSLAGKLAKNLNVTHVDTDTLIVDELKTSITDYVNTNGEQKFRQLESRLLAKVSKSDYAIISTGGGIVLKEENCKILKDTGSVFYLQTSPSVCAQRIRSERNNNRFLLEQNGNIEEILGALQKEREGIYQQVANFTINTDFIGKDEACTLVLSFLQGVRK